MSNFEKLVAKMRAAQIAYNEKPTAENLELVEDLEIECDDYLDFIENCEGFSFKEVKKFVKENLP